MKVLFVCTGNACRSPLADALLKKFRPDINVASAGTYAYHKVVDLTRRYAEQEVASEFLSINPAGVVVAQLVTVARIAVHPTIILVVEDMPHNREQLH